MKIEELFDSLYGESEYIPSTCNDYSEGISGALKYAPNKPYCSVRKWIIIDLDISDQARELFSRKDIQATFLYAQEVVHDSKGRFSPGNWVRSTALVNIASGYLFETRNTVYVLLGDGRRKIISAETANILLNL